MFHNRKEAALLLAGALEKYNSVSQVYEWFQDVSDQEALEFLEKWEKKIV